MDHGRVGAVLERVDGIAAVIRESAAESEQLGHLAPAVMDALRAARLFGVLIPAELGGDGLTIPEFVRVTEAVATIDASTGWTVTILADGALFARLLSPEVHRRLCSDPPGLLASSLNPVPARAVRVDGGYVFSGAATYLSGSSHAQWITAAAIVLEDGEMVFTEDGLDVRAGVFPIEQATSLDSWNTTGMRATGSTDYEFTDVFVEADWTFEPLRPRRPVAGDVLSAIPLWAQLGGSLASCTVGAARNAIERYIEIAAAKVPAGNLTRMAERAPAQIALGEAEGLAQAAHAVLTQTVDDVWARGVAAQSFDNDTLARQRLGVVTAVRLAAQAVDLLHDAAGMSAVARDTVLERCWRDVHTMTQHVILTPARFEIAGRVLLGLDPAPPSSEPTCDGAGCLGSAAMAGGELSVRIATAADFEAVAAMIRRAISVTGATVYDAAQIATWSSSFTTEGFERFAAAATIFVVEVENELAGVSSLVVRDDGRAEVDLLYVDPTFGGRGVARVAVEAVESEARGRDVATLWTDASALAAPVFEHLGYEVVERYEKRPRWGDVPEHVAVEASAAGVAARRGRLGRAREPRRRARGPLRRQGGRRRGRRGRVTSSPTGSTVPRPWWTSAPEPVSSRLRRPRRSAA